MLSKYFSLLSVLEKGHGNLYRGHIFLFTTDNTSRFDALVIQPAHVFKIFSANKLNIISNSKICNAKMPNRTVFAHSL